MVLPVTCSNAEVERVFSLKKKIQTEFRCDLGSDTINSLICCKQNTDFTCVNFIPSDSLLKAAKAATKAYNVSVCSENKTFVYRFMFMFIVNNNLL